MRRRWRRKSIKRSLYEYGRENENMYIHSRARSTEYISTKNIENRARTIKWMTYNVKRGLLAVVAM